MQRARHRTNMKISLTLSNKSTSSRSNISSSSSSSSSSPPSSEVLCACLNVVSVVQIQVRCDKCCTTIYFSFRSCNRQSFYPPKIKENESSLTHSPWMINEDTEPFVSAESRRREIPGGELGSYPGLPVWHLFPPEAASIPIPPDVTCGAPTPVALLFLPIQAFWLRRAWTSCGCRGRGA